MRYGATKIGGQQKQRPKQTTLAGGPIPQHRDTTIVTTRELEQIMIGRIDEKRVNPIRIKPSLNSPPDQNPLQLACDNHICIAPSSSLPILVGVCVCITMISIPPRDTSSHQDSAGTAPSGTPPPAQPPPPPPQTRGTQSHSPQTQLKRPSSLSLSRAIRSPCVCVVWVSPIYASYLFSTILPIRIRSSSRVAGRPGGRLRESDEIVNKTCIYRYIQ